MSVDSSWTREEALTAFDDHLRRARGVCAGTRANYTRWVRAFLEERFPDGHVLVEELGARDVVGFIERGIVPLSAKDFGVGGDVVAFFLPVPSHPEPGCEWP